MIRSILPLSSAAIIPLKGKTTSSIRAFSAAPNRNAISTSKPVGPSSPMKHVGSLIGSMPTRSVRVGASGLAIAGIGGRFTANHRLRISAYVPSAR